MRNLVKNLLLLGLISLLPVLVFGQAISGDIVGTVRDSSGAVVADAAVDATHIATNVKSSTKTNSTGEFHFFNLPSGRYSIQVTSAGLKGGSEIEVKLNQNVNRQYYGERFRFGHHGRSEWRSCHHRHHDTADPDHVRIQRSAGCSLGFEWFRRAESVAPGLWRSLQRRNRRWFGPVGFRYAAAQQQLHD